MKPYALEIKLLGLPSAQVAGSSGGGWRARAREADGWIRAVCFAFRGREPRRALTYARVRFVRHSAVELDYTNLVASFKAIEDGVVAARVLADDAPAFYEGGRAEFLWERAAPRRGFVTVSVEEVRKDGLEGFDHANRSGLEEGGAPGRSPGRPPATRGRRRAAQ